MENIMEKSPDKYQSVGEPSPEAKKVQEFFLEQLAKVVPENGAGALAAKPIHELFMLYKEAINSPPTYESFKKITENISAGIEYDSEEAKEFYKEFLVMKIPKELVERQVKDKKVESVDDISFGDIELLHSLREKNNTKMFLGFHVANLEYESEIPQSNTDSVTIVNGEQVTVPRGNTHYSASEEGLYKDVFKRGENIFLYFVEGSASDFGKTSEIYRTAHQSRGWVNAVRKLPILFKTKLTPEVFEALGVSKSE